MKVGRHEYGQFTGVHRRSRSISSIRRGTTADSFSSKIYDRPTRTGVPQESGCQSEPTRSKAKGQAFRFPRPCRLDSEEDSSLPVNSAYVRRFPTISRTPISKRSPSVNFRLLKRNACSSRYRNKWERFNADTGAVQAALEQAPKVLHPVCMNRLQTVCEQSATVLAARRGVQQFVNRVQLPPQRRSPSNRQKPGSGT